MRMGASAFLLAAFLLTGPTGCDRRESGAAMADGRWSGRLTVTGSSTVAPLAGEIAKRFESLHPGVRIDVQTGGTSRGISDVRRGTADIGMASRGARPEESDLRFHTIALDGITLIVHRDNPVASLNAEQVRGIFIGRITNWRELGGRDASITVVNKAEGRATLELFLSYLEVGSDRIRANVVIGDNQHGIRTVAADPNAVGYVSIGTAAFESSRGTAIRLPTMGRPEPTASGGGDRESPLSRPLNLVTRGSTSPLAEAFVTFAGSPEVHDLVKAQHFVPPGD